MDKKQVAHVLEEIGKLLELKGENPFKARAFYGGARIVETLTEDLNQLVDSGQLEEIKGIGKSLAEQIRELVVEGRSSAYEELRNEFPPGVLEMLAIPGLGPKKVGTLYRELGISNPGELEYACRENRLLTLPGFGAKSQANILAAIEKRREYAGRWRWAEANVIGFDLLAELRLLPQVKRAEMAGSWRRLLEVVKDLDLVVELAPGTDWQQFRAALEQLSLVKAVSSGGENKLTLELMSGINCDLRLAKGEEFAWTWLHFTGSKEHNTLLRQRAKKQGLKLNEYGLFQEEKPVAAATSEREAYAALGLPYIPPELREGLGEIEVAEKGQLPELVNLSDLKGVWHVHTNYSDGIHTLADMAEAARRLGWKFLGIADHSRSAYYAHGLSVEDIQRQQREIDVLNRKWQEEGIDFRLLKGIEVDILPDGRLDYPDEVLASFDFVIASIHSGFKQDEKLMTRRLLRALEHPAVTMLGHPTGRLLLARPGYPVDLEEILQAAFRYGKAIELNANPYRLDLDWRWCRRARELGVQIAINPDAHRREELGYVIYGVNIARKGWLTAKDVLNSQIPPWKS